jgi:hypothetical protein
MRVQQRPNVEVMQAVPGRKMLASNTFNKAATPNAEFNTSILQFAASNKTPFSFIGE